MKQQGASLFFCLIIIAIVSLISLAMLEQLHWQQRLVNTLVVTEKNGIAQNNLLRQWLSDKKFDQETCRIDWPQATMAFDWLLTMRNYCLLRKGTLELRYLIVVTPDNMPKVIALIVKDQSQNVWRRYELEI